MGEKKLKKYDMHEEKQQGIQQLMHVFSHDLRNPLLNIQALMQEMNLSILEAKEAQSTKNQAALHAIIEEDLPDTLAMLQESTSRMDAMISGSNAIYHCMYDALECEIVDMDSMFQRCFKALKLEEKGVVLQCDAMPDVYADPLGVKRLVTALFANAEQAMQVRGEGGSIVVRGGGEQGGFVAFEVQDDGCGFMQAEIDRVFDPFFSGQQFADGAGLGLARVKALVERYGGKVWVSSVVQERGATLLFCLPKVAI